MRNENVNEPQNQQSCQNAVMHSASSVIKICEEALLNAGGAYNALRLLGAKNELPGLVSCEQKREEALNIISQYLKHIEAREKISNAIELKDFYQIELNKCVGIPKLIEKPKRKWWQFWHYA
jgi:hypothetical protein